MNTRLINFILLTALVLTLVGCVVIDSMNGPEGNNDRDAIFGSGRIITRSFPFNNFSKILLNNSANATIRNSPRSAVQIAVDDNIERYLDASQSANQLSIGLENRSYRNITFTITIDSPDLTSLNINGAASVTLEGFELPHDMEISSSGASLISGYLRANAVHFTLSGASVIDLSGGAKEMKLYGSGSIVSNLFSFPVKTCDVSLSGGSVSNISVSDQLDLALSGGSILYYKGNPVIRRSAISGGSMIHKVN